MSLAGAGEVVRLSPLVVRVVANNPGPMTAAGTNTYLIGREELAVLDPGPADPAHLEAIFSAAGHRKIRWVVVTHTHPDHSPAAAVLADKAGAALIGCMLADDGHQDRSFRVDTSVQHGDLIMGNGFTLEAIATPGHVANHFCYLLREEGLVFTGDHIMGGSTVVIIPPSGDMADYLHSLALLKQYPIRQLLPGHGDVLANPIGIIDGLIAHRLRREEKVVRVLRGSGEMSLQELTPLVYDDVDASLHLVAQVSLWAHLLKLEKDGTASKRVEQHWLFGQERWSLLLAADGV
ncbi:MAG TPA: MBL fold metallo-hydrolase [Pseudomonadales bacterium]|nr:MBL fold metallo-hydrolase [Pseudomonadales bacterium]